MSSLYLFNGLGAGNIGDEAMFLGWRSLGLMQSSDVVEVMRPYDLPQALRHLDCRWSPCDSPEIRAAHLSGCDSVILLGDTPIAEYQGTSWPLGFHSEILRACRGSGRGVAAIATGVDPLQGEVALELFQVHREVIASWTTRSADCAAALLKMGVPADRVRPAADIAWLLDVSPDDQHFAAGLLERLGVRRDLPLVALNCVNEVWSHAEGRQLRLAALLREAQRADPFRVLLLCNETRAGEYFDYACAERLQSLLGDIAYVMPNHYFTPSQMAGLISTCRLAISQRYHFAVLAALARVPVALFSRVFKLPALAQDLDAPIFSDMAVSDPVASTAIFHQCWSDAPGLLARQQRRRAVLGLRALSVAPDPAPPEPVVRLASVEELSAISFRTVMRQIQTFAIAYELPFAADWSQIWEYPWLWKHLLNRIDLRGKRVVDVGSALSILPWWVAILGAKVTLVETERRYEGQWRRLRDLLMVDVEWRFTTSEELPVENSSVDFLTSISVIEHQSDKAEAVAEAVRVLRPGGHLGISFDVYERSLGMTFPEWNGMPLCMQDFEERVWSHPAFGNRERPEWNLHDVPAFLNWHQRSAAHHNYAVGAAVLRKGG